MVINKRKKNSRQRGSFTHGWGEKKKHRGAGHRGGRGNAGSGKRGDAKKPCNWASSYFGKRGFKKKNIHEVIHALNIKTLEQKIPQWLAENKATESSGVIVIDLGSVGYTKLLSVGTPTKKMQITVKYASAHAVEKIQGAGGTLTVQSAPAASAE